MNEPARRVFASLLALTALLAALMSPAAAAAASFTTEPKYAAIVVDATTGEVIYARRADSPRYPASITKVMTLYLAFEAMAAGKLKPTDRVVMSPRAAAAPPSKLGLRPGESLTVDEAIRALATKSANDVAVALAEHIGGTEARFTALMTIRAQELGMKNTRFVNPHGLPDSRNISTARDIAVLSKSVMRDFPQYYSYFGTRTFTYRGVAMNNHNRLMFQMPGVDGIKTGFTNASGFNLAASAVRDGRRLIAVVLGGPTGASRDAHTRELLTAGFDVMSRRARGEKIILADNIFDGDRVSMASAGSTEQGSNDARGALLPPVQPKLRSYADLKQADAEQAAAKAEAERRAKADRETRLAAAEKAEKAKAEKAKLAAAEKAEKAKAEKTKLAAAEKDEKAKSAKGDESERADAKAKGEYLVQVGAFKSETDAKDRLKEVNKKWASHFGPYKSRAESNGGSTWRARFGGFSKAEAQAACKALAAKKEPCMVVSPS